MPPPPGKPVPKKHVHFANLPNASANAAATTDFHGNGENPLRQRIVASPFWAAVSAEPFAMASTLRYAYGGPRSEFSGDYNRLCSDLVTAGFERSEASRCVKALLVEKLTFFLEASNSPCQLPPLFWNKLDNYQAALDGGRMSYADFRRRMCHGADELVNRLQPPISSPRHVEIKRSLAQWGLGSLAAGAPSELVGDRVMFDSLAVEVASAMDRYCKTFYGRSPKTIANAMAHVMELLLQKYQTGYDVDHQLPSIRGSVWICDHVLAAVLEANGLAREQVEAVRRLYLARVAGLLDGWRARAEHAGDFRPAPPEALAKYWRDMLLPMRQEPDGGVSLANRSDAWVPPELPGLLKQALAGKKLSPQEKVEHAKKLGAEWRLAFERYLSVFAIEGEARNVALNRGAAAIDKVIDREVAQLQGRQHAA
ncbi:hypothetical protein [Xylophilus sp. GOD-11R]|uniref:hypothetical protein n=1 Tax=Xylophilus sp. GOD-11R TaxID=3089814 RepID=UPI00298C9064|nr:hypothetical protein [Xylophilus sp. GOD-11R]WPB55276.1 hypothetical protein R9X41_14080 [Xylophilus sp. GOD-11R]